MTRKKLNEEVLIVKAAILEAIPTGVSFAAIIIALAQVIKIYQEQELFGE